MLRHLDDGQFHRAGHRARSASRSATAKVICGLSGGVDSSVVAALLHKAIGDQLVCIFVDNGLLRKNERQLVEVHLPRSFQDQSASRSMPPSNFCQRWTASPIRSRSGRSSARNSSKRSNARRPDRSTAPRFLAQGTLYPDVIESGHGYAGTAANIKLHHNVGGLPERTGLRAGRAAAGFVQG